ncbi:DUF1905 domain-containing protein [Arthrobacter agilis]|uniref:DUF1905 domain-containing protein n=1 Tax=Arthrobacter agilis TaxID=37921 RepID=UPI0023653A9E|nr:DUF1905 domain-containing protein [Arthrobacter agilis]WDF32027.1 DUF1905 domain-containing protein [Arthrobacter agilis]
MEQTFSAVVFEWRGPAPYYWLIVPDDVCDDVRVEAPRATYGWGAIPVSVRIGATEWETSMLPYRGGYVIPLKAMVRRQEHISEGQSVAVALQVTPRGGRAANGTGSTT